MPRYSLNINGIARDVEAGADESLLGVLRDRLDFTGTKYGCGEGQCGACTVLIDGQAVRSCQSRVGLIGSRRITTIEGLATDRALHPVQQAFLQHEAMQCGYCTPGMIMAAVALLRATPAPSDAEIVRAMERNICRCGTYPRIVSAIRQASRVAGGAPRGAAAAARGGHEIATESSEATTSRAALSRRERECASGKRLGVGPQAQLDKTVGRERLRTGGTR